MNNKVLTITDAGNERKYSKREIERAKQARELFVKLGNPSTAALVKLLNTGSIMNCDITAKDVLSAEDIYGPPLVNLNGMTTSHKAPVINMNILLDYVKEEQISNIDTFSS